MNGVHNTSAGGESTQSSPGLQAGNYPANEGPSNVCDQSVRTKYLNFGSCNNSNGGNTCGLDTGFYITLRRGSSVVQGVQVCTANDAIGRDPLQITLEGSNENTTNLTFGQSWNLIYDGGTGLEIAPPRLSCSLVQCINNSISYKSYRFLVIRKRYFENAVQYSEVQFFGY